MSNILSQPRGLYFEDFKTGHQVVSAGRTITEADIVNFAGLSGDFNQMHMDAAFCQASYYGQRVAHGLLVLSIASGLMVQTGVLEGTVIAFREIENWKFSKPVFIGDTVLAEMEIKETRPVRRLGGGAVTIEVRVKNQHGDLVMSGLLTVLIADRPA